MAIVGFNSFDNDAWIVRLVEFIRGLLVEQERVRVVGVCYGHQIVGRALGATVGRSEGGWETSVCEMELSGKGKEVFGERERLVSLFSSFNIGDGCF